MAKHKVITITKNFNIPTGKLFTETEYTELQKCLDDGYLVKDHILTITTNSTHYGITFILEK
jgi:hypothetical protein